MPIQTPTRILILTTTSIRETAMEPRVQGPPRCLRRETEDLPHREGQGGEDRHLEDLQAKGEGEQLTGKSLVGTEQRS